MTRSTLFKSNRTQAVRLPKAVALPEHVRQVEIIKHGSGRLIMPAGSSWDDFFDGPRASPDFLDHREQPPPQRRAGQ